MSPLAAFTLIEVMLATVLGMFLSGLAIITLMASQKSIKATEQLAAQTLAIRTMTLPVLLSASRSTPLEPQPCGSGILASSTAPVTLTTSLPAPGTSLPVVVAPLRTYSASIETAKIAEVVTVIDAVPVVTFAAPQSYSPQSLPAGQWVMATLDRAIPMAFQQSLVVLDMASGQSSFHQSQVWRQPSSGPYLFTNNKVYLSSTAALTTLRTGTPLNAFLGRPLRFTVPIL